MTYGAYFRPGMWSLPDQRKWIAPPLSVYENHVAGLAARGQRRASLAPSQLRRMAIMFNADCPASDIAQILGCRAITVTRTMKSLPAELTGPAGMRLRNRRKAIA